jgi:hypothetical protein
MPFSALNDRSAVLKAIAEYDDMGREAFLARYGYGPSRSYFLEHEGKIYDSKAIAGVAVGKQFPEEGPLKPSEFSGGDATVRAKLEALEFRIRGPDAADAVQISSEDVERIRLSRGRDRYANLSPEEHAAYERVHVALGKLGRMAIDELGGADYEVRLTSGFHLQSGVRGAIPKDLWFGVFRRENAQAFLGNPQVFAIVSGRGVELGFYASTHPSDFSNADLKARLRAAAPAIYAQLPAPGSDQAATLARALGSAWGFRRKSRLEPNRSEFPDLESWLHYFESPAGAAEGGGAITRSITGAELDETDLADVVRDMARTFQPLMVAVRAELGETALVSTEAEPRVGRSFNSLFEAVLTQLEAARKLPFKEVPELWDLMAQIQTRLDNLASLTKRPHILSKWSLGKGVWANVPWIALLNRNVTTSTQSGVYVVLLIAEDLSAIYVTLNQGMTELVRELGQKAAVRTMKARSEAYQAQLGHLTSIGLELGNAIDLKTESWRAKNYEVGTIAYARFAREALPSDRRFEEAIEGLLQAYDGIVDAPAAQIDEPLAELADPAPLPVEEEAYSLDDAMSGLFMPRAEVERIISSWKVKKNIILQGAPGVGKSFVAQRLAYALMGCRARSRVETVQFHQSYAYEDFVQGYRPTEDGGFVLRDGAFVRFCSAALKDPARDYVLIIDEINRGNLSKIFGELMLLIEQDKRNSGWEMRLAYAKPGDAKFYVPDNLYIIGMMNTADRSLSMVDYALRRRFAFITLLPQFASPAFRDHLATLGVPASVIERIVSRMAELNEAIATDTINLGPGFQIGHSFFVPADETPYADHWYERIIETEIRPLLEEYWFDEPSKAANWRDRLLLASP